MVKVKDFYDFTTTILGAVAAAAIAGAPFYPQYAREFSVAQAISVGLVGYFSNKSKECKP